MKRLLTWWFPERREVPYEKYVDEQSWAVRQVLVWGGVMEMLVWLPYMFTDPLLQPNLARELFWLRLTLPVAGLILLLGSLVPVLSRRPMLWAHLGFAVPLQITPIITNLTDMDPRYASGYVLVMLVMILFPVPFLQMVIQVTLSYLQFLVGVIVFVPDAFSTDKRYSFTDLSVAYFIAIVMLYVTERLRLKAFVRKTRLRETRRDLAKRNQEMANSLVMAREVQANLLPREFPETRYLEVRGAYTSMDQVGGDFFAVRGPEAFGPEGKSKYAFFIADACGHGVSAALISAMAQLSFDHALVRGVHNPAGILSLVNRELLPYLLAEHYLTAFAMVIDEERGTATYCNAGHRACVCVSPSGEISLLNTEGFILGMFEEDVYEEHTMHLSRGHTFLFYTDGIVEARNAKGEEYGMERLVSALRQFREENADALLRAIQQDALRFAEGVPMRDDVTLLLVRVKADMASGSNPAHVERL